MKKGADREEREHPYICNNTTDRIWETRKQVRKLAVVAFLAILVVITCAAVVIRKYLVPANYYNYGIDLMYKEQYSEAIAEFAKANGYKDSEDRIRICEAYLGAESE